MSGALEVQSIGPPAHSIVPGAFVLSPPGHMDSWIRAGVCGKSHDWEVAFHVSDLFFVRPATPSMYQVMESGVQETL